MTPPIPSYPGSPRGGRTQAAQGQGSAGHAAVEAGPQPAPPVEPAGQGAPAVALIESSSIAFGYLVADALVKKSPVRILRAQPASPGKFFILYAGEVAEVEEAHQAGLEAAGDTLIDELLLPFAHKDLLAALEGTLPVDGIDSLGVIETLSLASALAAADAAAKAAEVRLLELRPPMGLGGKSYFTLSGPLEDLQMAVERGLDRIRPGMVCRHAIIPNPHGDLSPFLH